MTCRCVYNIKESKVFTDKTLFIRPTNIKAINEETEKKTGVSQRFIED